MNITLREIFRLCGPWLLALCVSVCLMVVLAGAPAAGETSAARRAQASSANESAPPGKIERAGEATAKGVDRAYNATKRGLTKAGRATAKGIKKTGEAIERFFSGRNSTRTPPPQD